MSLSLVKSLSLVVIIPEPVTMIIVYRNPALSDAKKYMERLRHLLLEMKDSICDLLEGECSPSVTTADFDRRWGYLVTLKEQLEVELKKAAEHKDAVLDCTSF